MRVTIDNSILTDIADSIREKGGASGLLAPQNMAEAISNISGGGGGLPFNVTYGDLVFQSEINIQNYEINHGLGVKPTLFVLWKNDTNDFAGNASVKLRYASILGDDFEIATIRRYGNEQSYALGYDKGWITSDTDKVTFISDGAVFAPGLKYSWIAVADGQNNEREDK